LAIAAVILPIFFLALAVAIRNLVASALLCLALLCLLACLFACLLAYLLAGWLACLLCLLAVAIRNLPASAAYWHLLPQELTTMTVTKVTIAICMTYENHDSRELTYESHGQATAMVIECCAS
jgi:hypothetical protein